MKHILLDEFHTTLYVTCKLPDKECLRIRRTLKGGNFTGSSIVLSGRFCAAIHRCGMCGRSFRSESVAPVSGR